MKKVIAWALTTLLSLIGFSIFVAGPAQADHLPPITSCTQVLVTPAQDAVPVVPEEPAVEAVPAQWWNFSPNDNKGEFEGPPAFPSDARGTWNGPHTNGGPAQETTGTFQNGNGNGSWFHRTPAVDAVPGTPEIPAVPAKDAVYKEECTTQVPEHPVTPVEPVVPTVPAAPVAVAPDAPANLPAVPKSEVPATVHTAPHGEAELAYTGAEDYILPAGIALLAILAGTGIVRLNRRNA